MKSAHHKMKGRAGGRRILTQGTNNEFGEYKEKAKGHLFILHLRKKQGSVIMLMKTRSHSVLIESIVKNLSEIRLLLD